MALVNRADWFDPLVRSIDGVRDWGTTRRRSSATPAPHTPEAQRRGREKVDWL